MAKIAHTINTILNLSTISRHFCKKIIKRFKLRPKNKFIPDLKNYIDKPYIDKKKNYIHIYIVIFDSSDRIRAAYIQNLNEAM